jgi:hypothetical protein
VVTTVRRVVVVVLDDLAGPLVLVVPAFDPEVDDVDAGFVVVVLEAFAPVAFVVVLVVLAEAAFGFLAVVLVVLVVLLAAVAAPARKVVVVVGFAPLGSGTVQVRREEPS